MRRRLNSTKSEYVYPLALAWPLFTPAHHHDTPLESVETARRHPPGELPHPVGLLRRDNDTENHDLIPHRRFGLRTRPHPPRTLTVTTLHPSQAWRSITSTTNFLTGRGVAVSGSPA